MLPETQVLVVGNAETNLYMMIQQNENIKSDSKYVLKFWISVVSFFSWSNSVTILSNIGCFSVENKQTHEHTQC